MISISANVQPQQGAQFAHASEAGCAYSVFNEDASYNTVRMTIPIITLRRCNSHTISQLTSGPCKIPRHSFTPLTIDMLSWCSLLTKTSTLTLRYILNIYPLGDRCLICTQKILLALASRFQIAPGHGGAIKLAP